MTMDIQLSCRAIYMRISNLKSVIDFRMSKRKNLNLAFYLDQQNIIFDVHVQIFYSESWNGLECCL